MKYFFLILLLSIYSFACSGNCMACHPILKESIKEKHHQILTTCIACHTKVPEGMTECGGDCFACHSQNKLTQSNRVEHQNLGTCKQCHINKEDLFNTPSFNDTSNLMNLLRDK
jgi:hypothetical protein